MEWPDVEGDPMLTCSGVYSVCVVHPSRPPQGSGGFNGSVLYCSRRKMSVAINTFITHKVDLNLEVIF